MPSPKPNPEPTAEAPTAEAPAPRRSPRYYVGYVGSSAGVPRLFKRNTNGPDSPLDLGSVEVLEGVATALNAATGAQVPSYIDQQRAERQASAEAAGAGRGRQ